MANRKNNKTIMKVGDYDFELRGFKHHRRLSQDSECFEADLYVNGRKYAQCQNDGWGGPPKIHTVIDDQNIIDALSVCLAQQPAIKDGDFEFMIDLEYIVLKLVDDNLKAIDAAGLKKELVNRLVFRDDKGGLYIYAVKKYKLADMLLSDSGRLFIKETIAHEVSLGSVLVNENIPQELLPQSGPKP